LLVIELRRDFEISLSKFIKKTISDSIDELNPVDGIYNSKSKTFFTYQFQNILPKNIL